MHAWHERKDDLAGLILAGGRSSRFGSEKAVAELCGMSMLDHAVAAIRQLTPLLAVSVTRKSAAEALALSEGLCVLHDGENDVAGPLAGIRRGLEWASANGSRKMLSLPCDCVLIPDDALRALLSAAGNGAAYVVTERGAESLCAVWPVSAAGLLESLSAGGLHPPVREVLQALDAAVVPVRGADAFLNINTRADLVHAAELLAHPRENVIKN